MDSFPEHNLKQTNRTKPTTEEVEEWDTDELVEWIQQKRPKLFNDDQLEKFKAAYISGEAFLIAAGYVEFFKTGCNLPAGISLVLANLASRIKAGETAGMAQEGKEQDISAGKSTDHLAEDLRGKNTGLHLRIGDEPSGLAAISGKSKYCRPTSYALRRQLVNNVTGGQRTSRACDSAAETSAAVTPSRIGRHLRNRIRCRTLLTLLPTPWLCV
jgi:hypothetical protein